MQRKSSSKKIKQAGRIRGQPILKVANHLWKQELRRQGLEKLSKKEERMSATKLAESRKRKEAKSEEEIQKLMDKQNEVEKLVQKVKQKQRSSLMLRNRNLTIRDI